MIKSISPKTDEKTNFCKLINILKKCAFGCGVKSSNRNIYNSKKYNAIIVKSHPYLSREVILGKEYREKEQSFYDRQITLEEWYNFNKEFDAKNPGKLERVRHQFKLFVYLQKHNFCIDISENDVRTQIIEIPMPNKITGDHNGALALSFEHALNKQLIKYISQIQTNIEILRELK